MFKTFHPLVFIFNNSIKSFFIFFFIVNSDGLGYFKQSVLKNLKYALINVSDGYRLFINLQHI